MIVVDTTVATIKSVFGNTPLEKPVLDVVNCLVLMKVAGIQAGLTFVNENAKVSFPRVDNSTLAVDLNSSKSTPQFASQPALSSFTRIMDGVINKWNSAIRMQATVAGILLAVYAFIVLLAFARVIYAMSNRTRNRGEGGGSKGPGKQWDWGRFRLEPHTNRAFGQAPGPTPGTFRK